MRVHASGDPRPTQQSLLADPSVRHPLKSVLRAWLDRDPVDAAEDANLLALALERLADERCGRRWRNDHGLPDPAGDPR